MAPKGRKGAAVVEICEEDEPLVPREKADTGKKAGRSAVTEASAKKPRPPKEVAEVDEAPRSPPPGEAAPAVAATQAPRGIAAQPLSGGHAAARAPEPLGRMCSGLSDSVALPGRPEAGDVAGDRHADRRILSAAAGVGATAGLMLMGPVSGAALGAVAGYTATQEGRAGVATRKAGALYLQISDQTVDHMLRAADRAVEEGRKRLEEGISSAPLPGTLRERICCVTGIGNKCSPRDSSSLDEEEARRMRERYPDRVPVICERSPYSDLPEIAMKKFGVPGTMQCGEFKYILHKHVAQALGRAMRPEQTIYIFVNGISPKTSMTMSGLYDSFRADNGFLYVRYGAENTLGECCVG